MNRSSTRGFKLSTVFIAVLVLAISAMFSNASVAGELASLISYVTP